MSQRDYAPTAAPRRFEVARTFAIVIATLSASGVYLLWLFFVNTEKGQRLDDAAFLGSYLGRGTLWQLARPMLSVVSISYLVVAIIVCAAIALVQKRWLLAVQVVAVIGGANLTTQVVKAVLDRPDFDVNWGPYNTLPSGHTTVAAATSVALVLALPRTWRPAAALFGAVFTAAMGISTLVGQWHRVSDVLAAILVTCAWGALACALHTKRDADPISHKPGSGTEVAVALLGVGGVVAAIATWWQGKDVWRAVKLGAEISASQQTSAYVAAVAAVVALSAFVFTVLLLLRQATAQIR